MINIYAFEALFYGGLRIRQIKRQQIKNKPARKTLRPNEYYNPKTKRYEYRYKDALGKEQFYFGPDFEFPSYVD